MNKLKIAVAGLGGITQVMHLPILEKNKDVEIVAICDKEFTKVKNLQRKRSFGKGYRDIGEMLSDNPDIDAVVIATRTDNHAESAIKCLDAGKHIFVEKPVARNAAETKKIVAAAEKNKKMLMVGMNNRFRADSILQRNFVKGRELGDIFYVKTGWLKQQSSDEKWFTEMEKAGGGVFMDNGIVMLDLGMWMLGFPEIKSVSSVNYNHNSKTVEDSNFTFVKFKNGACLTIEVSWSFLRAGEFFYCNVFGTNGSASINPLKISKMINKEVFDITPKNIKFSNGNYRNSFENELKYFVGAITGTHELVSTGREAIAVMEVLDAVYKSAQAGKEIIFK